MFHRTESARSNRGARRWTRLSCAGWRQPYSPSNPRGRRLSSSMARVERDPFVAIAATLNAQYHEDYKSSYLEVFFSICSRAGTSLAQDNFCTCFPNIDTIAQKFKHSRMTVIEAIPWLEAKGYLFKERRQRASNEYIIILKRDWFLEVRKAEGDEAAKEKYKAWIREQQARARGRKPVIGSDPAPANPETWRSSGNDIKGARVVLEVPVTETSEPTIQKSQPLHLDLDPPKTITTEIRSDDLEPELPLGPFSRRKIFD